MNIRLKCSECGEIADYDKGKILKDAEVIYRKGGNPTRRKSGYIVVKCKKCPEHFKVKKDKIL
jgi:hypothetical protein